MIVSITIDSVLQRDRKQVYTVHLPHEISPENVLLIGKLLSHKTTDRFYAFVYEDGVYDSDTPGYRNIVTKKPYDLFDIFAASSSAEIAYLPGMTDNVGKTAAQIISNYLKIEDVRVHASEISFHETHVPRPPSYNPLVKYCKLVSKNKEAETFNVTFLGAKYIDAVNNTIKAPKTSPHPIPYLNAGYIDSGIGFETSVCRVDLHVTDDELINISETGIQNRGALNLSLEALKAIRTYFDKEKRAPNDIELETLAQTWSEHCKHNIFSASIDEISSGLYRHYIKRATEEINSPICVSVFSDNAGAIVFDDDFLVVDKVETHNSPSALDPFGGAETGVLGVNRDIIGFGLGAKPVMNAYYFCFAEHLDQPLHRDKECTEKILPPKEIMDGVIMGVNTGGNCSGIPTAVGSMYFHSDFCGKPLVFVGSTGIIPRNIGGSPSHIKTVQDGDYIVVIGGRVGRDGIHGATFSSHALKENFSSTVVQVGSPITQKKLSDAIIKEARDRGLYNAITDNGAGGLSSSVGEMGINGFTVELEKVPLKTKNIMPWEIWVSESQERMTLAVPQDKYDALAEVMHKHDVEISIIGRFNSTRRAIVRYNNEVIMDIDTEFLHNGHPKQQLHTEKWERNTQPATQIADTSVEEDLLHIMGRKNVCSREFLVSQYDHEVQGTSVIKPLHGKGNICADAVVLRPVLSSTRGIVKAQGLGCVYCEIDPYCMAACAIDTAIRNHVATGGNIEHMALIDNFCWCDATNPKRLWQLKLAAKACYDYAVAFGTPFISGKDSMFNDFKGYDAKGNTVHISAPPTLLISTLGVIEDVRNAVTQHVKGPGALIYILGMTYNELGMSEYQLYSGKGNLCVPKVDAKSARLLYKKFHEATLSKVIASAIAPGLGGIAVSLIKSLIGGGLGAEIDLRSVPTDGITLDDLWTRAVLFSESQSRIIASVELEKQREFEEIFADVPHALIGRSIPEYVLKIHGVVDMPIEPLEARYKEFSMSQYKGRAVWASN
ncbi:phosphoribosylformylglycinamidine synthase subunit PurL [Candidatus Anaplasma sp. TIGMIC]|uniref:phosphoribosylformylglycinamidine synthase subunit PurL n=1 Tax=Candidatus Anaplasma sp. TIGMIC TaxID=3020713 RepID=UPI002330DD28|nr:AIR synthase-related protein [Candidatus Anaplasma sp. TIGMIC]MDB1135791.1 AIR synthase-related protein [Candidatus Anaplasma sp. TIGMIC]